MAISNEAVEVTARALAADGDPMGEWDRQEETYKSWYRNRAKRILEAAAPIIRAECLDAAADDYRHYETPNARLYLRARAAAERGGE